MKRAFTASLALIIACAFAVTAVSAASQLVITSATVADNTLTITGMNFGNETPLVTLALVPLLVTSPPGAAVITADVRASRQRARRGRRGPRRIRDGLEVQPRPDGRRDPSSH